MNSKDEQILNSHGIRIIDTLSGGPYSSFKKCRLHKDTQQVDFVYQNEITYRIDLSALLFEPIKFVYKNGRWRKHPVRWEIDLSPAIRATHIRRLTFDPRDPYNGLKIFLNNKTAIAPLCSHIQYRYEPNNCHFNPALDDAVEKWFQKVRPHVTHIFPRVKPDRPFWGHFHTCSLAQDKKSISIKMAGVTEWNEYIEHTGDTYPLGLHDLLNSLALLDIQCTTDLTDQAITIDRIKNSRKDKNLTIWLSDGEKILVTPHDVLSICDYRYDHYLGLPISKR